MRKIALLISFFVFFLSPAGAKDYPQVFQIVADDCSQGPRRVQTGFLAEGYDGILTALHGVVDCNIFHARPTVGDPVSGLEIVKVDVERDVALLGSDSFDVSDYSVLPVGPIPEQGDKLRVVGYPQALLDQHRIDLTLESNRKYLENLLPSNDQSLIQDLLIRASPAIGISILSLTGDIQPGHSGAPILDLKDRVIGIGNGGLKGGTVGIGWGIPIDSLDLVEKNDRQTRISTLRKQSLTLLFDITSAVELSFSAKPEMVKPGSEVILELSKKIKSGLVFLGDRGPLPKRTLDGGEKIIITVPGDMKSGFYHIEIRQGGMQILSENKVKVENWIDSFNFYIRPQNAKTGSDVTLHLNYPAPSRYFQIFIKGNYGRVDRKLYRKETLGGGRQIIVTIPDDIMDSKYYIELKSGRRSFTAPVYVDKPRSHRAPPAN
ncbi:hypothetical protein HNR65_002826 [Desulfosalsimonas propionicica]|uniref:Serine protease n=1 Tax=Desulfosalsimonas propionicica TaxID=332175 RepID=A0A7W0CB81_9BACT|nr:serine protease [Desulfosalsimonas propionicica]MBA2882474.1 hypothetical protein [Desulfosalsimonas propionicica]